MFQGLSEYMDAACERQQFRSDRALARAMKIAQMTVTRWRTGKGLPGDVKMRVLAQLAGADEEQALVLLNIWRATDESTREIYRRLLRRLAGSAGVAIAVTASIALGGPPDSGRNWSVFEMISAANVYYGKFRRFSRRVAAALLLPRAPSRLTASTA